MILTLPTRLKDKLPAGFAYPLWPSLITEALRETPQLDNAELVFKLRDELRESRWSERVLGGGIATLLKADYHVNHSPYFPGWKITVFAVPSNYLTSARDYLRDEGLAKFAKLIDHHGANPNYSMSERMQFELEAGIPVEAPKAAFQQAINY